MDPGPRSDPPERGRRTGTLRRPLRLYLPGSDHRVIDLVVLGVGFVVAVVVGLPILAIAILVAFGVATGLGAIGAGETLQGVVMSVGGFGGGLVLVFLVLHWISRRLPSRIRAFIYEDDPPDDVPRQDPNADPTTVRARVSALDAALSARETAGGRRDPDDEPPSSG